MRFVRPALVASAALVPVLTMTGCQSNPSTAAYVGDQTVSTKQLQHEVNQGWANAAVRSAWSLPDYRQQVLDNQITHAVLAQTAAKEHVSVPNHAGSDLLQQVSASFQGGPDQLKAALIRSGVAPSQRAAYFQDVALAGQIAVNRGLVTAYRVGLIGLKDRTTATTVAQTLQGDESSYAKLARQHPGQVTSPKPVMFTSADFANDFGPQYAAAVRAHSTFVLPVPNSTMYAVVHVFSIDESADQLSTAERGTLLQEGYSRIAPTLLKKPGVKIKVNPRFGSWNAKQGRVDGAVNPAVITPKASPSATPETNQ